MKSLRINHTAVWILAVLQQGVGAGWYGIFRNRWMQLISKQALEFEQQSSFQAYFPYIISFLGAVLSCYVLAWLFKRLDIDNARDGILVAALIWLAFSFVQLAQTDLFSLRSIELSFINGGNSFVDAVLCGAMLGAWKKYEK